jgi:hypothetical protein
VLLRWWPKEEGRTYQLEERSLPDVVIESVDQLRGILTALRRDPAADLANDHDDLRMMYDTLTAMQSRVAKLEASLGAPGVSQFRFKTTSATTLYTKEQLDAMPLHKVIDVAVRDLPVMRKEASDEHRLYSKTKIDGKTPLEKQCTAYEDVFAERIWPEFEEFTLSKERILTTPPREYSRRTLKDLDDLLPTGLLFDHWSVATGRDEPVLHTEALQELHKAVKEALGMERGDWT